MRLLIAIVLFSLTLLLSWFIQHSQSSQSDVSLLFRNSPIEHNNGLIDTDLTNPDRPDNTLEEIPFMYQTLQTHQTINLQNINPAKPVHQKIRSSSQMKSLINLSLPSTVHPTTPGLKLPDNPIFLLENNSKTPGISVGGAIEWDDKANKAKGAKISITIPTG